MAILVGGGESPFMFPMKFGHYKPFSCPQIDCGQSSCPTIQCIPSQIDYFLFYSAFALVDFINLFFNIVLYYFISCLLISAWDKIKNNKTKKT